MGCKSGEESRAQDFSASFMLLTFIYKCHIPECVDKGSEAVDLFREFGFSAVLSKPYLLQDLRMVFQELLTSR
jgi:hypothetical protein